MALDFSKVPLRIVRSVRCCSGTWSVAGLALSRQILFVTDSGSGLLKGLRERFGKKLAHQSCEIHKIRHLQRHLTKPYRKDADRKLTTALEQTSYTEVAPVGWTV